MCAAIANSAYGEGKNRVSEGGLCVTKPGELTVVGLVLDDAECDEGHAVAALAQDFEHAVAHLLDLILEVLGRRCEVLHDGAAVDVGRQSVLRFYISHSRSS